MTAARYTRAELRDWMCEHLSELLDRPRSEIDPTSSFEVHGLDSSSAVEFSGDLERLLGATFDSSLAFDYPSIEELLDHLQSLELLEEG
jgi:acyl carrier protein